MSTTTFAVDMIGIEDAPEAFPLEPVELDTLRSCEAVIARGVQTFIEVGEALAEIRDGKLYRADFTTFEHYCRNKWGIGDSRARQLIGASNVAREIQTVTNVTLSNEGQARAAAKAAPADRPEVLNRAVQIAGDRPLAAKHITQAAAEITEQELPPEYDIIKRRLAAHDIALLSNMQGQHRAFVTRKEGMTGIVTFDWANVLSKLERLEAEPEPVPSAPAFRMTCPTCGETILNGVWGDLKECGSCWHKRQRASVDPDPAHVERLEEQIAADRIPEAGMHIASCVRCGSARTEHRMLTSYETDLVPEYPGRAVTLCSRCIPELLHARAALARLDQELPADLSAAGYYWHSAVPIVIAHNDGWRGDAPTMEKAIEIARLRTDAKGEPIAVFPALSPMECKALIREAKVFIESGADRKLPTIGKLLRIAARMALEATE